MKSHVLFITLILDTCLSQSLLEDNTITKPIPVCDGYRGRKPGTMLFETGTVTTNQQPNSSVVVASTEACKVLCEKNSWCQMAEFRINDAKCNLYNIHSFQKGSGNIIYFWKECTNKKCTFVNGRCNGFWVQVRNKRMVGPRKPLQVVQKTTLFNCLNLCLSNRICGSVNHQFDTDRCELVRAWDTVMQNLTEHNEWNWISWHCCDTKKVLPDTCGRAVTKTCAGYWVEDPTADFSKLIAVGNYRTFNRESCRESCSTNPFCTMPVYKSNINECYLMGKLEVPDTVEDMYWLNVTGSVEPWSWKCCSEDIDGSPLPETPDFTCVCVTDPSFVVVVRDDCLSPNVKSLRRAYNGTAYRLDPEKRRTERDGQIWQLVSNGAENLWLSVSKKGLRECSTSECEVYSSLVKPGVCPKIISRSEWHAEPPKETTPFAVKPHKVFILNTVSPKFNCFSLDSCSEHVRHFQKFHMYDLGWWDIGYNFLIGEDGSIFEGRGWKTIGAHTKSYNSVSIGIAFIGWFEFLKPSAAALTAAKQLIECGVSHSYIDPDYMVFAHRDVRDSKVPGKVLYQIIQNWPHYGEHRSTEFCEPKPVIQTTEVLAIALCSSVFVIICLVSVLILICYRNRKHHKHCSTILQIISANVKMCVLPFSQFPDDCEIFKGVTFAQTNPETMEFSLAHSRLFFLTSRDVNCSCIMLVAQLAYSLGLSKHVDLCATLANAYFFEGCSHYTCILVAYPKDFLKKVDVIVLHMKEKTELRTAIDLILKDVCVCKFYRLNVFEFDTNDFDTFNVRCKKSGHTDGFDRNLKKVYKQERSKYQRVYAENSEAKYVEVAFENGMFSLV